MIKRAYVAKTLLIWPLFVSVPDDVHAADKSIRATIMRLQGAFLSIDYSVGSLVRMLWQLKSAHSEAAFMPSVATGLLLGDGLWTIPAALLSFAGVRPPVCMSFAGAQ